MPGRTSHATRRVLNVLKTWVSNYWMDLQPETALVASISSFLDTVSSAEGIDKASQQVQQIHYIANIWFFLFFAAVQVLC